MLMVEMIYMNITIYFIKMIKYINSDIFIMIDNMDTDNLMMNVIGSLSIEKQKQIAYKINQNIYYYLYVDQKSEIFRFEDMSVCMKIYVDSYNKLIDILKSDYSILYGILYDDSIFSSTYKYKEGIKTKYDANDILQKQGFQHRIITDINIYNKNKQILMNYYESHIHFNKLDQVIAKYTKFDSDIKIFDGNNMLITLNYEDKKIMRNKYTRNDAMHAKQIQETEKMLQIDSNK